MSRDAQTLMITLGARRLGANLHDCAGIACMDMNDTVRCRHVSTQ